MLSHALHASLNFSLTPRSESDQLRLYCEFGWHYHIINFKLQKPSYPDHYLAISNFEYVVFHMNFLSRPILLLKKLTMSVTAWNKVIIWICERVCLWCMIQIWIWIKIYSVFHAYILGGIFHMISTNAHIYLCSEIWMKTRRKTRKELK